MDSREEMIVRNLPLVAFIVGKMADESGSSPIDREDAIAYGTEGLIQAVDNFRHDDLFEAGDQFAMDATGTEQGRR